MFWNLLYPLFLSTGFHHAEYEDCTQFKGVRPDAESGFRMRRSTSMDTSASLFTFP